MQTLSSTHDLGPVVPNIATLLKENAEKFADKIVFQEPVKDGYKGVTWTEFYQHVNTIATNLRKLGFQDGDKLVLFSRNRLEMLELEMAVMAGGGVAVPIFAGFKQDTADLLIKHSDAKWLAVEGASQLDNIGSGLNLEKIFSFDNVEKGRFNNLLPFYSLLADPTDEEILCYAASPDDMCLNMYTSGTMGLPKCVQLTHKNILSQQAALNILWDLDENDRFLSYLPWHHSFGGIFELFTALSNGATISLENSYGKDPGKIFESWKKVKPTLFFSVPKVYQALYELARENKAAEDIFYNSGLKFIFTAAASLPMKLTLEFEKREIPVIEGWGLTETSPCCTLTDPALTRDEGVVGMPIPGVSIMVAEDDEILVKGPNIMIGYYNNDEANEGIFTDGGWYRTGDTGKIRDTGLQLISRKDRIFKLSNGEKVIPTDLEKQIEAKCHYVQYAIVAGKGEEYPVCLIFPNKKLLENPDYEVTPVGGCFCPRNLNELGRCFTGCLQDANNQVKQKFAKVKAASIIMDELSVEDNTLTPSMKMAPKNVLEKYKKHLNNLYGGETPVEEEVYVIELKLNQKKVV